MAKRGRGRLVWCQIVWFVSSFEWYVHTYLDWECAREGEVVTIFEGMYREGKNLLVKVKRFCDEGKEKMLFVCRLNVIAVRI